MTNLKAKEMLNQAIGKCHGLTEILGAAHRAIGYDENPLEKRLETAEQECAVLKNRLDEGDLELHKQITANEKATALITRLTDAVGKKEKTIGRLKGQGKRLATIIQDNKIPMSGMEEY